MKVCPKCQTEYPDDQIYCGQRASPLIPQDSAVPGVTAGPALASLGARFAAHLIDLVFLVLVFVLAGNTYGALFGGLTAAGFNVTGLPAVVVIAVSSVVFLLYLILFEGLAGATPGKFILGLRVKSVEGSPCGLGAAFIRNLLRVVDGIAVYLVGLIVALVGKKKQRVGDLAARTIVVKEAHRGVKRVAAAVFLVLCLVGAIFGSIYVRQHPRVPPVTFGITNLRFADSETAPALANPEYKPEDDIKLFYEVPGYERDSDSKIAVVAQNQVLAPDGKPFLETKTIEVRQKVGEDAGPVKYNFHFQLPPWAPPGKDTVSIQAEDQVARKTQSASTAFAVNASPVETSPSFIAKNIELASSRDGAALIPPVFTAGQTIWLRFRMLGMKADDRGRIVLTEDWGVVGPDGKALFQRNDDSMIDQQFVYLPPFIPYREYVSVPSDATPGEYRFHVVLHDKIGGADFTIDQPFTLNRP